MIRKGAIAAAAVLALGTVAMATNASAQGRHGDRGTAVRSENFRTSGNVAGPRMNTGAKFRTGENFRAGTGYAKSSTTEYGGTRYRHAGYTKTSWNRSGRWDRDDWRHHRRYGGGWGPGLGVGFADYGYGYDYDGGPDYGYVYGGPSYVGYGASYGGCNCGYPGYAAGYDYDYPAYAYAPVGIGIGFGFGGWGGGWGGFHHHHHW